MRTSLEKARDYLQIAQAELEGELWADETDHTEKLALERMRDELLLMQYALKGINDARKQK